jgi:hypothetical protein
MIYKNTSVKRVIAKVITDLDLQEGEIRIADFVEWSGEALEKIGAFPSFETKVTGWDDCPHLKLEDYQAKLPCDFHTLVQASYAKSPCGPYYPMRYGTGSFDYGKIAKKDSTGNHWQVYPESYLVVLAMTLYKDEDPNSPTYGASLTYDQALQLLNSDPVIRNNLSGLLNQTGKGGGYTTDPGVSFNTTDNFTYVVTNNYIKTNVRCGYIMMSYQAVPTDSDGYPMIPDDPDFMEAIYWYITMKLLYPQWKQGSVRDQVYYDARRSWNYNCKKAYGNAIMPNIDQLESIKNSWNRLVPELEEHATGFSTLGQSQIINNAN